MTRIEEAISELDRDDAVALLACQTEVLALMSANASLPVVLDAITSALERLMPGSSCSVLLLDDTSGSLRHGSAPSLPADYLAAIDGLVPGPDEGSCGSAAYYQRPIVASDVLRDPRWTRYRDAATAARLRACWSSPILGATAAVAGTFAVYHAEPHDPTERERRLVDRLTYLASVAIGHAAMFGALTVSEERLRRAFEDSAVALALLDTDGTVTRSNATFLDLTGRTIDDQPLVSIIAEGDRERVGVLLAEVCSGHSRSAQCEAALAVGDERVVAMTMSLVRGEDDEPVQVSVNMLDITERLAAQRERRARLEAELARSSAEAASRAKSAFLSAVSHEMRTPLQAITGFAEVLGTLDLDAKRRHEALRHITTGATHLLALVDDTLDLSRIEADALPLAVRPLAVALLVTEVLEFLAPVADEHTVELAGDAAAGTVRADHRRLRQVLINLVSNGIRYSGPGSVVRVGARRDGSVVRIEVADNGPGIAPEVRARLFEPFFHADGGGDEHPTGEGVGLGLLLARGLAEAMGGRLDLNDGVGGGTVAVVTLPATDDHAT